MKVVESFVERNRKEAEDSIKALSKEAEELRARLKKVEAALERWQAVSRALAGEPEGAVVESTPAAPSGLSTTVEASPADLAPAPSPPVEIPPPGPRQESEPAPESPAPRS